MSEFPRAYLYRRIVKAKLFIDSNFREKINLDEIAEEASFSRFHFIRLFKESYGSTPHQYLISLRLNEAEKLMQNPDLRIYDICLAVGFESVGTFTTLFRKVYGISPGARQNEIIRKNSQPSVSKIPGCFAEKQFSRSDVAS